MNALQLCKAKNDYITDSIFLYSDLTKTRHEAEYLLCEERRHRLATGEHEFIIFAMAISSPKALLVACDFIRLLLLRVTYSHKISIVQLLQ